MPSIPQQLDLIGGSYGRLSGPTDRGAVFATVPMAGALRLDRSSFDATSVPTAPRGVIAAKLATRGADHEGAIVVGNNFIH